jgi:hypothetical protein
MIDNKKLKETLLSNRTRTYCILDGAAIDDLPKKLYQMDPPHFSLIRGELTPDMVHVAPYLVQLKFGNPFTNWILDESFGKNWGIFVQTIEPKLEMRRHFQALLTVHSEDGQPLLFRFYDPRVFRKFFPTCDKGQIATFFGKVNKFFVEAEEGDVLLSYAIENDELKQREIDLGERE